MQNNFMLLLFGGSSNKWILEVFRSQFPVPDFNGLYDETIL